MATRFDPIRDLDRFFSEVTRTPNATTLPMDLYRDGEVFIARIDMPGVDPNSIDVDVEDRTLTVRARRESEVADKDVKWLTRERTNGTYARQLTLGNRVALDRIRADFSDGVLTLTIPVAEEARPRKISVSHASGQSAPEVVESSSSDETRSPGADS